MQTCMGRVCRGLASHCIWQHRVWLFLFGFAKLQGRVHGPTGGILLVNIMFSKTLFMTVTGAVRKNSWKDVFIRTLAVTAYFALIIRLPVVAEELINVINYI